jgi:hypothetical protein
VVDNINKINVWLDFIDLMSDTSSDMAQRDWQALTKLTAGAAIEIERVRLVDQDVAIEGRFALPALAQLAAEDQVFVAAFVRCHGSIKQMEQFFNVSYPTIKDRLNRIGSQLPFVEVEAVEASGRATPSELLSRLERGEVTAGDVLGQLRASSERKS